MPKNSDFYRINFEKEIVVQGRTSLFLSVDAYEPYTAWTGKTLWVIPYIQPQTFESRFEGWTYYVAGAPATRFYFRESDIAKTGPFGQAGWDSVEVGDSVKAVSMHRRTLPGETPSATNGPIDRVHFETEVLNKGRIIIPSGESVYYLDVTIAAPAAIAGTEFLLQIGQWSADDNWYINQLSASDIAYNSLNINNTISLSYSTPAQAPNQFDGQSSANDFPLGGDFAQRLYFGVFNPATDWVASSGAQPRITFRIDYDGEKNSHLKINFLIAKVDEITEPPFSWLTSILPELIKSDVVYGQKLAQADPALIGPHIIDYEEVHLFGYEETNVRTGRTVYQNEYDDFSSSIEDDRYSFGVLKTNPKITGNIKLTVDSGGALSLNSIDASEELSDSRFKKFAVSADSTLQRDLYVFLDRGKLPAQTLFQLYQKDDQYLNTKRSFSEQYDNFYNYGVEQLNSKFYDESLSFFAPLWMRKELPEFFVVFRLDHPLNPLTYDLDATKIENFSEFFRDAQIIKTFDMRESSPLGTYLRKTVNDPRFVERPFQASFIEDTPSTWFGIDYASGSITGKDEFLYDFWKTDNRILDFEDYITQGFERNGLISTNLINLEFLFDDSEATPYTINRYFGLYVKESELAEFELEPTILGAITGQGPAPKAGVDGEPYNLQPFVQQNANGIILPVHYYHNPTGGPLNTTAQPEFAGFTKGKFPLPAMVDDPLRIFYTKDRFDRFKRVNKLQESDYGSPGSSNYRRVTELSLFDKEENISDFGGITEINSQIKSDLLGAGYAQMVIYIEDIAQSGKPLAQGEQLIIEYKKLNTERRDYYYRLIVTSVIGTTITFNVLVPDYSGLTPTVPTLFATQITIDTAATLDGYVDSYLRFQISNATILLADQWDVAINDGNVVNASTTSVAGEITFFGEANYTAYRWTMEANPIGLQPGESWDYPVHDPFGRDNLNNFSNEGTPEEVALAIAECVNKFTNGIVKAFSRGNAVYLQSLKQWEDGNNISIKRIYVEGNSYPKALGYYEQGHVDLGGISYTATPTINIEPQFAVSQYISRDFYIVITPIANGQWTVLVRYDVDPLNPTTTGVPIWYGVGPGSSTLMLTEFFIDLTPYTFSPAVPYAGLVTITWYNANSEQYFVGGVKRKRSRALVPKIDGERFYQNRKAEITGDTTIGSNTIINITNGASLYVGSPITGPGIPSNAKVLTISFGGTIITINKLATSTGTQSTLLVGELSIINDEQITQSWFQVQKGNFSRLKAWEVQGNYVYSLPSLEAFGESSDKSILQVGNPLEEFFYTPDKRIISFNVFRPKFGILSVLALKTFDVDTFFSDYSYTPAVELFRYYNREELSGNYTLAATSGDIPGQLLLNTGENYDLVVDISGYPLTSSSDEFDIAFDLEFYDSNDSAWKKTDTIVSRFTIDPVARAITIGAPVPTGDDVKSMKTLRINTQYPPYFYDFMEVPNDYVSGSPSPGPYNAANLEPSPQQDQTNQGPQYTAVGTRNYVRKILSSIDTREAHLTQARITNMQIWANWTTSTLVAYPFSYKVRAQGSNYYADTNISTFAGFASLQDFLTEADLQQIQKYSEDQAFEKFTYQMLLSEYDRLRENQQKDLAVKSKVVPSILKWVQEGTDARDNYYRLNNSTAFGITNFSPDPEVDFTEPLLLTHEFPYISGVPKDYPIESLEGSRSYFFQKLDEIAYDQKSWYELLTTDNTRDWFTKYFVVGYPTELNQEGGNVTKSREERYTFFNYVRGLDLSQTLFRGAKISIIDYDTTISPRVPINESQRFAGYRFAAIARFVTHSNFEEEKPLQIEIIENEKFKTVLVIVTLFEQDYRLAAGFGDYSFFYYAIDQLRNSMQTQTSTGYGTYDSFFQPRPTPYIPLSLTTPDQKYPMELPYTADPSIYNDYRDTSTYTYNTNPALSWSRYAEDVPKSLGTMRPRQLFLGGGRLELDDTKLGGKAWRVGTPTPPPSSTIKTLTFRPLGMAGDNTLQYPDILGNLEYYPIYKEAFPALDQYRESILSFANSPTPYMFTTYPALITTSIPSQASPMTVDGALSEFSVSNFIGTSTSTTYRRYTYSLFDTRVQAEDIKLDYIQFPSTPRYQYSTGFSIQPVSAITNSTNPYTFSSIPLPYPPYTNGGANALNAFIGFSPINSRVKQTFNLRGGTLFYQNRKSLLSFASITSMFNQESGYILYRKIDITGSSTTTTPDFNLNFVGFDKIKKTSKLYYRDDTDKPLEYEDYDFVGYDPVKTNEQEYEFRHRGYYEPKMLDILSFWAREDEAFTRHYEKDFVLANTHIDGVSQLSGTIRNYFYNKVSAAEVLKIARTSSYKSLYPLIGEIAIDRRDISALDSSWDSRFYRKYTTTTDYITAPGTEEMQESKVFLASKAMIVPDRFDLQVFTDTEISFELIEPKKSIGSTTIPSTNTPESRSLQTKPVLKIGLNLKETLKNALLAGIADPNNFDEFAWFNLLGIPEITYTPAEIAELKTQYIEKNILPLYEISEIVLYQNLQEGLPLFVSNLNFAEKIAAGYRVDSGVKAAEKGFLEVELEKTLDTKAANSYTLSAVLKRI